MKRLEQQVFTGERALFARQNIHIEKSIFEEGESPLKESSDIEIKHSIFRWKYPLWYSKTANVHDSLLLDGARAGIWKSSNKVFSDIMK